LFEVKSKEAARKAKEDINIQDEIGS